MNTIARKLYPQSGRISRTEILHQEDGTVSINFPDDKCLVLIRFTLGYKRKRNIQTATITDLDDPTNHKTTFISPIP